MSGIFGYEYFSGANVVVEMNGFSVLEAAGISLDLRESRRPIYGYSSRHFDAVARGQVIVQGSLVVNYVHQDYLFEILRFDQEATALTPIVDGNPEDLLDLMDDPTSRERLRAEMAANYPNNIRVAQAFQEKYWDAPARSGEERRSLFADTYNPIDLANPVQLKITFGERHARNAFSGFTGLVLDSVYFVSRGIPIQISEDVIVEEYDFFARNIYSLNNEPVIRAGVTDEGDVEVTLAGE